MKVTEEGEEGWKKYNNNNNKDSSSIGPLSLGLSVIPFRLGERLLTYIS